MGQSEIWGRVRCGICLEIYLIELFMEFVERYTKPSDSWNWLKDIQDRLIYGICFKIYRPECLSEDQYDVKLYCSNVL
jgi:hypothetical protein